MQKTKICFFVMFILAYSLPVITHAETAYFVTEMFYSGLANVIESNMNAPDKCVRDVERYYSNNKRLVLKIREETQGKIKEFEPIMNEYMKLIEKVMAGEVSEEELAAFNKELQKKNPIQYSAEVDRYTAALETFTQRYPKQGMKIAAKSVELAPDFGAVEEGLLQ